MNNDRFHITRSNFGAPDNDDDGYPDAVGSLDFDKISWNQVSCGDTVMSTFDGHVAYGAQSPVCIIDMDMPNLLFLMMVLILSILMLS